MSVTKRRFVIPAVAALALLLGCQQPTTPRPFTTSLYAVDSNSGKVYEVDGEGLIAASTPIVTTKAAAGEIEIADGKAFVAVGYGTGGLYYFNKSFPSSGATQIGDSLSVQYLCIESPTKAYLSVWDYYDNTKDGLYYFNPSNPGAGLSSRIPGTAVNAQGVVIGSDGRVYLADNGNNKILRLNAAATGVQDSISANRVGTTFLLPGSISGAQGIFVANTGGFGASPIGSIDFIENSSSSAVTIVDNISVFRLAAFDADHLIATGGWASSARTYIIDLSVNPIVKTEVMHNGSAAVGGGDIVLRDGVAYVADNANGIYAITQTGSVLGKISIGGSGEMIMAICSAD